MPNENFSSMQISHLKFGGRWEPRVLGLAPRTGTAGEELGLGSEGRGGGTRSARPAKCAALRMRWGRDRNCGPPAPSGSCLALVGACLQQEKARAVPLPRQPLNTFTRRGGTLGSLADVPKQPPVSPPWNQESAKIGLERPEPRTGDTGNRKVTESTAGALPVSSLLPFLGLV